MPDVSPQTQTSASRFGIACALLAQLCWGLFPLYFIQLKSVPASDVVAHRALWAFVVLILLMLVRPLFKHPLLPNAAELTKVFQQPNQLLLLVIAAVLIASNWLGLVWAVTIDRTLDASIGYYICPQVVVLLGLIFEKEKLSPIQWIGFGLTTIGVVIMAGSATGIPWLGLMVAFTFGFYALIKKRITQSPLNGLTFETGALLIPAFALLAYRSVGQGEPIIQPHVVTNILLLGAGFITIIPLALYVSSVKRLPLSTAGLLQFLGPTIQFLIGVFCFKEPFDQIRLLGFAIVWVGVGIYLSSTKFK